MKKILVAASIAMLWASGVYAAGTAAGSSIDNNATLTYSVGGVAQTPSIASNTDTFVVDNKIDMIVAHSNNNIIEVVPGATAQVLTFQVRNTGNKVQDYDLTAVLNDGNPFGETDNFDATNVTVCVDSNGNGACDAGEPDYIDELSPDTNATVLIVADIPASRVDGDVSEHTLVVQVAEGGTSGTQGANITGDSNGRGDGTDAADDPLVEQIVFADGDGNGGQDGANDGKYADYDAYKVVTATLDLTKTSCVYDDPVNGKSNPKRIPGATIIYMFDINNTGSADATDITIKDTLQGDLDGTTVKADSTGSADNVNVETNATSCSCSDGNDNSSGSEVADSDNDNQKIQVDGVTVGAQRHTCVSFQVDIK